MGTEGCNSDTRGFTADRWKAANDLYRLSKADQLLAGHVTTHRAFDLYMKEATSASTNASQHASLQSMHQIYRALLNFEYMIKDLVDDNRVTTSNLWAMTYLNVKVRLCNWERLLRPQMTFHTSYRSIQATSSSARQDG